MPETRTAEVRRLLAEGLVIPAHPLALTEERRLDERRQRALTRYYLASGAGGLAVGVHTTQFAVRDPAHGLYEPLLRIAAEEAAAFEKRGGRRVVRIAGVIGATKQAVREAETARRAGYDAVLLGLGAMRGRSIGEMLDHCREVGRALPLFGFYLQTAAGGIRLPAEFWRGFFCIEDVAAVKVAPFDRYATLEVVRSLAESGRAEEIPLYTGNDDSIVQDLVTPFRFPVDGRRVEVRFRGGLLGHWAVWTKTAVRLLERIKETVRAGGALPADMLSLAAEVTDCNAAFFDAAHGYAGCIAGIHEVLRRQGLLRGRWCLDPKEDLSRGQSEEIDRVIRSYPHLADDSFVAEHLSSWLAP